jgi:hypothetical protein
MPNERVMTQEDFNRLFQQYIQEERNRHLWVARPHVVATPENNEDINVVKDA